MKSVRLVGYTFGGLSAAYAGYYMVLYLTRWEWQRALMSGVVLLLVVEVLLATVVLLTRFSRMEDRLEESDARVDEVRRRLEQTRTPHPNQLRWVRSVDMQELDGTQRTFVFVPVLMAAGAALSGIAMVIQKLAGATARPGAERRLAGRLAALTAPELGPRAARSALEDRPAVTPARTGRKVGAVTAAVGGLLLAPVLWSALADATQTRPEEGPGAEATALVFRVEFKGDGGDKAVQLAARDLWETCRRSTAALNDKATLSHLDGGVYSAVISPALPPHDLMRLRGCIEDASTNRTTATVLGEGHAKTRR
ncbi:hypothetical protein [Streptomyces sp. NBC_00986]|uniref:hypothetical protein n=1 Tax=Streptomyces sp. NBC_00986 TaxID=2903702 RepID=UPI00386F3BD0|nr:hypothetical protein OG504_02520 [Streptomyces sp. NBC_00986]